MIHKCSSNAVLSQNAPWKTFKSTEARHWPQEILIQWMKERPGESQFDGLSPGDSATAFPAKSGVGDHCPGTSHVSAPGTGAYALALSKVTAGGICLLLFLLGREEWKLLTSSLSLVGRKAYILCGHCNSALQVMKSQ